MNRERWRERLYKIAEVLNTGGLSLFADKPQTRSPAERECERLRSLLRLATDTLDTLVDIHAQVRMDTDEDRELHDHVIASFRKYVKTLRENSQ